MDTFGLPVRAVALVEHAGGSVPDVAADAVTLHRLEDVAGALDQLQAGGLAVQAGAKGADDGVGTSDGGADRIGVRHLADDDPHPVAPGAGDLGPVAGVGGDGVAALKQLGDGK